MTTLYSRRAVSIYCDDRNKWRTVRPLTMDSRDRDDTAFSIMSDDGSIELIGTMDEVLDFSSSIALAVYGWVIDNGHADWINMAETVTTEGTEDGKQD